MQPKADKDTMFQPIEDDVLLEALNALGRSINLVSTYGDQHPVFKQAIESTLLSMQALFTERKKVSLGAFNGVMTIDEVPVNAVGTLLKSLERRLVRLRITGLRIGRGITKTELVKLTELLSINDVDDFSTGMNRAGLSHISSEATRFEAVRAGETVANESALAGAGGNGILVLEDDLSDPGCGGDGSGESPVHVDQIVAFLQGDLDIEDENVSEELSELASDPARLGQMIMESVAIRQSATELSGESLSDVVLGCLRRTYDGLRKQPAFQTSEGKADLQKALLLLEESMLDKIRNIAGADSDPELDRQIVQAIREMDENLEFELAANQYLEHREAIEKSRDQLTDYVRAKGEGVAQDLISNTDFPAAEWKRIVVDSHNANRQGAQPQIMAGLNSLTTVFEKLERLMKSNETDGRQVSDLLGQANDNLDDTVYSTKEKLEVLSKQLDDTGTIGGQGREMSRNEILTSIAEISQELMQPLTAINASLEMMLGGYVGEVNSEQRTMLNLASNSGAHLTFLMKELIEIVGCPANRGVDERFHTTSDQVVFLKQEKAGQINLSAAIRPSGNLLPAAHDDLARTDKFDNLKLLDHLF